MASFPRVVLPTPSQRAAWNKLREEHATAGNDGSLELAADRAGEAGHMASAFWGRDSLMALLYHTYVVRHFTELALDGPPNIETDGCRRRAMVELLRNVLPQLSQRLTTGTLAPGKCKQEEEAYYAETLAAMWAEQMASSCDCAQCVEARKTGCTRVLIDEHLSRASQVVGAIYLHDAMLATLHLLALRPWHEPQLKACQNFVLACLAFIESCGVSYLNEPTANMEGVKTFEWFATLGPDMQSLHSAYDKAFFDEVQHKWAALREKWKRKAAAKEALHDTPSTKCALPSCDKAEQRDGDFKLCATCKEAKYCSKEHQAADWKRHKKECKNKSEEGKLTAR